MQTFTISEAADVTGLSKKAVRNRVDRGQLRAVLRDGVRRIPLSELHRAGLMRHPAEAAQRQLPHEATPDEASSNFTAVVTDLVNRIERQATELAELRALTVRAESLTADRDRLEQDLFAARARITQLEARRRWFGLRRVA